MVAFEKNPLVCTIARCQLFEDFLRRRSAIDIITKKNCDRMMALICRDVCFDTIQEASKKVRAPMDIANRVNAHSIGHTCPWLPLRRRGTQSDHPQEIWSLALYCNIRIGG